MLGARTQRARSPRLAWGMALVISASMTLTACGSIGGQSGGQAADECEGYPQEDIEFIVPTSPGGGFDAWARMMAPFLEKYLAGDASVVVRNLPGAGMMRGVSEVYSAEPDGSTIMLTKFESMAANHLLGQVPFGLDEFTWLGQVTEDQVVFFVGPNSDVATMADLTEASQRGEPIRHASREASAIAAIGYAAYGIDNFSFVLHEGSSEAVLSIIRGDTDVTWLSLGSTIEYVEGGDVKPILYVGDKPAEGQPGHGLFDDVQDAAETGHPELNTDLTQRRVIAAPPDTPDCIRRALEQAILETLEDPEFAEQASEANRVIVPAGAEETAKFAEARVRLYQQYKQAITQAYEQ